MFPYNHRFFDCIEPEWEFGTYEYNSQVVAAMALFPDRLKPRAEDTAQTLLARLYIEGFFDAKHPAFEGIATSPGWPHMVQSRAQLAFTKAYSVVVAEGEGSCLMFSHKKASWTNPRVNPSRMPRSLFQLGVECFLAARSQVLKHPHRFRLSETSMSLPPNHCEIVALYKLLGSKSPAERENYKHEDFVELLGKLNELGTTGSCVSVLKEPGVTGPSWSSDCVYEALEAVINRRRGSQVPGSDILLYIPQENTHGACNVQMRLHPGLRPTCHASFTKYGYALSSAEEIINLDRGNIYIISALSDLSCLMHLQLRAESDFGRVYFFRWIDPEYVCCYADGSSSPPRSP